jgi:hypothetical protein
MRQKYFTGRRLIIDRPPVTSVVLNQLLQMDNMDSADIPSHPQHADGEFQDPNNAWMFFYSLSRVYGRKLTLALLITVVTAK